MNYAALLPLLVKRGRNLGPKAMKAAALLGPFLAKSPKAQELGQRLEARLLNFGGGGRVTNQIELAKEFAREALTEQTLPERQDLARVWLQRAKVQEMSLKASENMPRKASKPRREQIARETDTLLAEIIQTMAKWAEL